MPSPVSVSPKLSQRPSWGKRLSIMVATSDIEECGPEEPISMGEIGLGKDRSSCMQSLGGMVTSGDIADVGIGVFTILGGDVGICLPPEISRPESTETSTPESTETSTPESTEISTPKSTEISTPESTEISTPESTEISTPKNIEIHTMASRSRMEPRVHETRDVPKRKPSAEFWWGVQKPSQPDLKKADAKAQRSKQLTQALRLCGLV